MILNEAAVKLTGLKNVIGLTIKWDTTPHHVVGVIRDMVMESPYEPVKPTLFFLNPAWANVVTVRLKPSATMREGLAKVEAVFNKYNPSAPFEYKFTDEEYARKFEDEKRIGNLSTFFAILAVFISCLGLFGLASFVAEQRTKEIGVRKVLGASVFQSLADAIEGFFGLVIISCAIAIPIAWYFLHQWLQKYPYRTDISWWIFIICRRGRHGNHTAYGELPGNKSRPDESGKQSALGVSFVKAVHSPTGKNEGDPGSLHHECATFGV